MPPDEHELLADLKRVCDQAPLFVLEFTTGGLSVEAEEAYAFRLVDVAEGLLRHTRHRTLAAVRKPEAASPGRPSGGGTTGART